MTEWGVVGVIIAVVGLIVTICGPLVKLISSISKLNTTIEILGKTVREMETSSHESHKRLWEHNEVQDKQIANHETRLQIIEKER